MKFSEYLEENYPGITVGGEVFKIIRLDIIENYEFFCREILKTKPEYDVV